tara:strand:+ start:1127 stop:1750 length:624 start_codon:yes stop_codon:yes gene_type:complete
MLQYLRNIEHLHRKKFGYKKEPTTDVPTKKYYWGSYYKDGTYQDYSLFYGNAKITTFKALAWHVEVLRYINFNWDEDDFKKIIYFIADIRNGFVTFEINTRYLDKYIGNALSNDFSFKPVNRKKIVVFKDGTGLSSKQKSKIVGEICGKEKSIDSDCIYECMLYINSDKRKITITNIAKMLNCSRMSIYRNMNTELKEERDLLNMSV